MPSISTASMRMTIIVIAGVLVFLALGALTALLPPAEASERLSTSRQGHCEPGEVSEELEKDCKRLIHVKGWLDDGDVLNWSYDLKIKYWTGVKVNKEGTAVVALRLREKGLTGSIPPRLGKLSGLTLIDLAHNELTGPIPSELAQLTNLKVLTLRNNKLTGTIPQSLRRMTSLEDLNLSKNDLTGKIPKGLAKLDNLQRLSLDRNDLNGQIPQALGNMDKLRYLHLSHNQLTGALPPSLGASDSIQYLRVKNNGLTGKIPDTYGNRDWACLLLAGNDLEDKCLPRSLKGRVKTQDMKVCPKK